MREVAIFEVCRFDELWDYESYFFTCQRFVLFILESLNQSLFVLVKNQIIKYKSIN